jgi:hypothetical protein
MTSADVPARALVHHQSTPFRVTIDVTWVRHQACATDLRALPHSACPWRQGDWPQPSRAPNTRTDAHASATSAALHEWGPGCSANVMTIGADGRRLRALTTFVGGRGPRRGRLLLTGRAMDRLPRAAARPGSADDHAPRRQARQDHSEPARCGNPVHRLGSPHRTANARDTQRSQGRRSGTPRPSPAGSWLEGQQADLLAGCTRCCSSEVSLPIHRP